MVLITSHNTGMVKIKVSLVLLTFCKPLQL